MTAELSIEFDLTGVVPTRVTRFEWRYVFPVNLRNAGEARVNVHASLSSNNPAMTIEDGEVDFGNIAASSLTPGQDTLTIFVDRRHTVPDSDFVWRVESDPVPNNVPVAQVAAVADADVGMPVTLDASASQDVDNDPLSYQWSLLASPPNSQAAIAAPGSAVTAIEPDLPGEYRVRLVVNDGADDSAPVDVVWNAIAPPVGNTAPVADIAAIGPAVVDTLVNLDGSGSGDADGDALSYSWSLPVRPLTSTAEITDPTAAVTGITPDVPGTYRVRLLVNDGALDSTPAELGFQTATATVEEPEPAPEPTAPESGGGKRKKLLPIIIAVMVILAIWQFSGQP